MSKLKIAKKKKPVFRQSESRIPVSGKYDEGFCNFSDSEIHKSLVIFDTDVIKDRVATTGKQSEI